MRGFSEALEQAIKADSSDPSLRELYLDGRFSLAPDDSFQELANLPDLERLSLGGCKIRGNSLENFPSLQNLSWFNLTDNAIADNLGSLTVLTNLKDLDLSGNRIADLSQLAPLTALQHLSSIDISGCPVENKDPVSVRKSIFEMLAVLPALKYVNGEDLLGNEKPVDDDEGVSEEEEEEEEFEEEEYEEGDDEEGGEEEGDDDEGAGGEAGGAGDDDDDDDDDGAGADDDDEDDDDEEEEEVPTAVLAQKDLLSEDEDEFLAGEEEEESDYDSDEDDAPVARHKRKRDVDEDSEEEEEVEESEESDYDGDD